MKNSFPITVGVDHWKHCGYNENHQWGYLPCKLKSINGTWVLIFPDGHKIDTRHDSTTRNGFRKDQMIIWVETGRSHR